MWHVDDLKLSHKESLVIDTIIASLRAEYEKVGKMTVQRRKVHDYLGMTLDFSISRKFTVSMEKYLDDVIAKLPDDMNGTALSPAAEHLFRT